MARPGPVDRLRDRLASERGPEIAARLPAHYQRLGRVVLVRWPESLRPEFPYLAEGLARELGVATVARLVGPAEGAWRRPRIERLFGGPTETEVREDGLRFRFDAARVLYSRGNRTERARTARLVRPGETVIDLFAGIGYFALPVARHGRPSTVWAVEANPEAHRYLVENVRLNRLGATVRPVLGDNRDVPLPPAAADRVLLGLLPDAFPWIERALGLLKPAGGWLHAHRIRGSRTVAGTAIADLAGIAAPAGWSIVRATERAVKPYGPGRVHEVVDAELRRTE